MNSFKLLILIAVGISYSCFAKAQIPDSGLIARYDFFTNLGDSSGSAAHGSGNNISYVRDRCFNDSFAIITNGVNSYVDIGKQDSLNAHLNEFSISLWFRSHAQKNNWESLFKTMNNAGTGTLISTEINREPSGYAEGVLVSALRDKTGKQLSMALLDSSINNGDWHHYALIVDNSSTNSFRIYLDGTQRTPISGYVTASPSQFDTFDHPIVLGASNSRGTIDRHYSGAMDEFYIYDRALDSAEVMELYYRSCLTCADTSTYVDTTYILQTDTITYVDTITFNDTITVTDTLIVNDTITVLAYDTLQVYLLDTVTLTIIDTVVHHTYDTVEYTRVDTVIHYEYDTLTVYRIDTVEYAIYDTLWTVDTITLTTYDTIYTSECDTLVLNFIDTTCNIHSLEVRAYPNPAQDHITIRFSDQDCYKNYIASVWTVLGQKLAVVDITQQETSIPISGLATGTYLIRLINTEANLNKTIKFVVK